MQQACYKDHEKSLLYSLATYQGGMEEPGGHIPVSSDHTQIAQEIQLSPGGPHAPLSGVDLWAHLQQKVIPVLVFYKY